VITPVSVTSLQHRKLNSITPAPTPTPAITLSSAPATHTAAVTSVQRLEIHRNTAIASATAPTTHAGAVQKSACVVED